MPRARGVAASASVAARRSRDQVASAMSTYADCLLPQRVDSQSWLSSAHTKNPSQIRDAVAPSDGALGTHTENTCLPYVYGACLDHHQ